MYGLLRVTMLRFVIVWRQSEQVFLGARLWLCAIFIFVFGESMDSIEKTCCFFGHRDAPDTIKPELIKAIGELIEKHGVKNFYVGNNGRFDSLVASALKEISADHPEISYAVVLAYLPKKGSEKQPEADWQHYVFPDGIESVPKKFCISWRNDWLIKNSQYVICYVSHITGGAFDFTQKAKKKGRTVINLSDFNV